MATENTMGDSCLAHLALTAAQITLMRENLCDWLEGVREDLRTPDKLADPERTRAEAAAYERLLAGVAAGRIAVPDEAAREFLRAAAEGYDKESGYAEAVAHHDAMHVVLAALEAPPECLDASPGLAPATPGEREAQRRLLDLVLSEHPEALTFPALGARLMEGPGDFDAGFALACAARDLVGAGLLQSDGLHVTPTRAALHSAQLGLGR